MLTSHKILPGAVFIADAHTNDSRTLFGKFLEQINNEQIRAAQLFIMGDCFDFLSSSIAFSVLKNRKYIKLIRKISKKIPVFYFEGNHDFNLVKILPDVKVFNYSAQPAVFNFKEQKIALMHGDRYENATYRLYVKVIRNDFILHFLNVATLNYKTNFLVKKILNALEKKSICYKNDKFIQKRASLINYFTVLGANSLVEGHFHQNASLLENNFYYQNLSAFACDKSFFQVQSCDIFKLNEIKLGESRGER